MTKLMEKGFYVTMLHKASSPITTGKIANQSGYRELNTTDSILYRKSSSVIIFSVTGMHVHIETPDDAITIPDLIGFYRFMPDFGLPWFYLNTKHGLR